MKFDEFSSQVAPNIHLQYFIITCPMFLQGKISSAFLIRLKKKKILRTAFSSLSFLFLETRETLSLITGNSNRTPVIVKAEDDEIAAVIQSWNISVFMHVWKYFQIDLQNMTGTGKLEQCKCSMIDFNRKRILGLFLWCLDVVSAAWAIIETDILVVTPNHVETLGIPTAFNFAFLLKKNKKKTA